MNFNESMSGEALVKIYDGTKHTEVSEEFILPDYLPDIKKIIRADAHPRIEGKYVSTGRIEFDGEIVSRLLFIDERNLLHAVSFNSSFSDSVEIPSVSDECIANLVPSPESLSCKTLNPRRVSIRLRLDTGVTVRCIRSFSPELSGEYSETETLREDISVIKLICGEDTGLSCSADLEADGALPQIGEVICCDVDMCFYECKGSDGRVLCRGDMPITVFYSTPTEDGEVYTVLFRKLPLAQVIAADGVDESYECTARGSVDEVKVNVSENGFGERRILELDISYRVSLNCVGNENITLTKDIYSCTTDVITETEQVTFNKFIRNYSTGFSTNHITDISDTQINESDSVLAVFSHPHTETVTLDRANRKLTVEGICDTGVLLQGSEGLNCVDYIVPFKLELEASGIPENFTFTSDIVCMNARGRLDSGKIYTDLELQINLSVLSAECLEIVKRATFNARQPASVNRGSCLRFFYPEPNEELWGIGKRFGIPIEELKLINDIREDGKLPDIMIIPSK